MILGNIGRELVLGSGLGLLRVMMITLFIKVGVGYLLTRFHWRLTIYDWLRLLLTNILLLLLTIYNNWLRFISVFYSLLFFVFTHINLYFLLNNLFGQSAIHNTLFQLTLLILSEILKHFKQNHNLNNSEGKRKLFLKQEHEIQKTHSLK
jgi:hypothetical protein